MAKKTATSGKTETSPKTKGAKKVATTKVATKKAAAPKPAGGPLARLKAKYGSKDQLVDGIAGTVAAAGEDLGALKDRLRKASNQQLLHLANVAESVTKTYGSRDKLIQMLAKSLNKAKDKDYLGQLAKSPLPRLYDLAKSTERRAKAAR